MIVQLYLFSYPSLKLQNPPILFHRHYLLICHCHPIQNGNGILISVAAKIPKQLILSINDATKPTLLLVHGFGASSYHFRYNIPELAKDYHVYAIDMLGFGWSDKPIMDYDTGVWRDQVIEFIDQIIFKEKGDKSIAIAGNSLGGYTAMYAASDDHIKEHVRGCILLNAAGRFCPERGEP